MTLPESIIETLTYSDHFSYPLTLDELHERLMQVQSSKSSLQLALNKLVKTKQVVQVGTYFCLPNRSQTFKERESRSSIAIAKFARAKHIAELLARAPGVRAIFVTGSLAVKNAKVGDDIDLMVITKNHRLWTTRLIVTAVAEIGGFRRHPFATAARDQICLNLYLTPNAFALPVPKRSLYTAYELIQAVPIYDPTDVQSGLLAANPWIKTYLPNFPFPKLSSDLSIFNIQHSLFLELIESLAYRFQTWYMHSKLTREYITQDAAFFHPHNPGVAVLKKLKQTK